MSIKTLNDQFVIETYYSIDYSKLEDLINETFGFEDYSIPCNEECGNDVSLTFTVKPEECEEVAEDTYLCFILNEMCYRDLIVPGEYLVEVSW